MVIWIVQDPSDYKLLAKGAGLLIACILAIIKLESHYSAATERTYEKYPEGTETRGAGSEMWTAPLFCGADFNDLTRKVK